MRSSRKKVALDKPTECYAQQEQTIPEKSHHYLTLWTLGRLDFDLFSPILMKPSERLLLHVKKIMSKFRLCGTISSPCTFALKFKILLRKGPQKIFPHHFFSCGPVIIWTCWCEKSTWKIEKSSISIFYEFFNSAKKKFRPKKK